MKYDVKEPSDLAEQQAIIKDGISSTLSVIELTEQLTGTKRICLTHKNEYETKIAWLDGLNAQQILLQRKTADTLAMLRVLSFL